MDSNEFWLGLWLGLGFLIAITIISSITLDIRRDKTYIENGYEQVVFPGSSNWRWQKIKDR